MTKGTTFFDNFRPRVEDDEDDKVNKNLTDEDGGNLTPEEIEAKERAELEKKSGEYADDEEQNQEKDEKEEDEDLEFFTTIINDKAEQGIFYFDPNKEYEGTGEEIFDSVIQDTLEKRYQEEWVDSIPEEYQSIFKHLKAGRPLDEWVEAVAPLNYDSIDLADEGNQKSLIEDHLALTGMDEEDIKDKVQGFEDLGTLEKEAKIALKYLKKNEDSKAKNYEKEIEKELARQERQEAEDLDDLKKTILSKDELGKFKLDKKERERLFDHITKPINKKGESKLVVNQKNQDKSLLLAYLDMIDFDFEAIKKSAESKVTSGLRQKLSRATDLNASRTGGKQVIEAKSSIRVPKGIWDTNRESED